MLNWGNSRLKKLILTFWLEVIDYVPMVIDYLRLAANMLVEEVGH